jgi:hypothetical protein
MAIRTRRIQAAGIIAGDPGVVRSLPFEASHARQARTQLTPLRFGGYSHSDRSASEIRSRGKEMTNLKGTKTHQNLKEAFAGESQANRRYLYFAKVADVEGQPEIASLSATLPKAKPATPTDIWIT